MQEPLRPDWRWILLLVTLSGVLGVTTVRGQEATPLASPFPDPTAPEFGPVAAHAPYRLALLVPFPDDPYWQAVQGAVRGAGRGGRRDR